MKTVNISNQTYELKLNAYEGAVVIMKRHLTLGELDEIKSTIKRDKLTDEEYYKILGNKMVIGSIQSWNLAGEDGVLPITEESLKLLNWKAVNQLNEAASEDKKK